MSLSGVHYNEDSPFASKKNADEYVDSAIARNIQHSLIMCLGNYRFLKEMLSLSESAMRSKAA